MRKIRPIGPMIIAALYLVALSVYAAPAIDTVRGLDVVAAKPVELKISAAKKGTVLVFLSAKCPCSASHEKVLAKLHTEFSGKGFAFLGLHSNTDEPLAQAKEHFSETKLPFAVVQDDHAAVANVFGALKTPHVFVLDPSGKTVFQGGVDDSHDADVAGKHFLKQALEAIDAGRAPDPSNVRALGCVIKRG